MIKPWIQWYDAGVPEEIKIPDVPLHSFLAQSAWRYPHQTALFYYGRRWTYTALEDLSYRFASVLQELGVRKGDRVAIHLPNIPQFVFAFYGMLRLGAIAVPTNPLYVERELENQFRDSGAKIVLTLDLFFEKVDKIRDASGVQRVIVTRVQDFLPPLLKLAYPLKSFWEGRRIEEIDFSDKTLSLEDLLDQTVTGLRSVDVGPDDLAVLQYTGGTTGISKGVMLTHRNLTANALQCRHWLIHAKEGEEVFLGVIPFFHAYGLTACMNLAVYLASPIVLYPRFRSEDVLNGILKHRVTIFTGVEAMYQAILNAPQSLGADLSSIRFCVSGAGPLHAEVQDKFERLTGGKMVEGYGLTEASPVTHCTPLYGQRKKGSIGLPLPGTEAKVVDMDTGRELRPGEVGELAVRGPQVMKGYWNRPEETEGVLREGWLFTGDLAKKDADGFFYIVDRKKEMIKTSGENVYPREVEEVLFRHPKIADAVVVGVLDSFKGEAVKAVVVLRDGTTATAEEIIAFCKKELARFKVPATVEFRRELPKNMLGKVLRRNL
ncbi:MAG: long-chain fatty acid--CoA ligase [Nitrospirae bacterium]|nr:long-chain fatty acid--CoA ligase [Nitrospirota bacterium]